MSKDNVNDIELTKKAEGNERRAEMLNDLTRYSTILPKAVLIKDIDSSFFDWSRDKLKITSPEGKEFPTFKLFSNQRFSEYSQSWKYTDSNNNLLLNFKAISRSNNPKFGSIQGKDWNIPGEPFFFMKRFKVLDDNGNESFRDLLMRQPMAMDFDYNLSIITTQYSLINDFNTMVNEEFKAAQCYICPNGHYMPMSLENISDESEYNIDDRQFYSQGFQIKVKGYILREKDFKIRESPYKIGVNIGTGGMMHRIIKPKADVTLTQCDYEPDFMYLPYKCTFNFNGCCLSSLENGFPIDFVVTGAERDNVYRNYKVYLNGEKLSDKVNFLIRKGDRVKVSIIKMNPKNPAMLTLTGYNPDESISTD